MSTKIRNTGTQQGAADIRPVRIKTSPNLRTAIGPRKSFSECFVDAVSNEDAMTPPEPIRRLEMPIK
jgi:hypothetical protein